MSSPASVDHRTPTSYGTKEGLDVDWLLHSKRDFPAHLKDVSKFKQEKQDVQNGTNSDKKVESSTTGSSAIPPPAQAHIPDNSPTNTRSRNLSNGAVPVPTPTDLPTSQSAHKTASNNEHKPPNKSPLAPPKKESRKSSWISSLGHKLSGNSSTPKNNSTDSTKSKSPVNSPRAEFTNPFDRRGSIQASGNKDNASTESEFPVPTSPRRPSVLVAAGTETKVGDHPGFLTSALRRLSSGNVATMGKGAGQGALCPRKTMNVDQNRERVKIADFDQNKLRRVAFCVDVEIAGTSAHGDEQHGIPTTPTEVPGHPPTSSQSPGQVPAPSKDAKKAKYKEKGEGAALKNPQTASQQKDQLGKTKVDAAAETKQESKDQDEIAPVAQDAGASAEAPAAPTMTRKKEKKKRSEAERKERKEKKRKQQEANGLVPLELKRDDDDSDSSSNRTTPGQSTPRRPGDQPTTDPLRIYKRCCQLREGTAMSAIKDQITRPAATLAEAPGTVAIMDLSGVQMTLDDIQILGDWLAVVPVRKLVLDDCGLGDEAIRIILAGLSGCKTPEQARQNRKLPRRGSGKSGREQMGIVERLSLKNNAAVTALGWKHIALFMNMSRSLRAIDLSGIPFPKPNETLSRTSTASGSATSQNNGSYGEPLSPVSAASLVTRAIAERIGNRLEELILSRCNLSASNVSELVTAAIKCKIRRLGLAGNALNMESLEHVVRYVTSGVCEGLDLGSNDLHDTGSVLSEALDKNNPLWALSLSDCNLSPDDITAIMPRLTTLGNFKFIDLSRNHDLFNGQRTAVSMLRKYLPKMPALKRIHLADAALTPDHVIALAEVFPDCHSLAHVNLLENEGLLAAMNSQEADQQEEAAAFLASLMTSVRVSRSIVAIEIEVPSSETSEVVRALASQVVAYSLRNMERSALTEVTGKDIHMPDKDAPEVLLHLVGHMDGYEENHDNDEPAPDEDYVIASTGIAKALGVCLRSKDASRVPTPRNMSPARSGTATPRTGGPLRPAGHKKPKDVSRELCESARKIRMRLRPALIKEDRAGNVEGYRRLFALDSTLQGIIQRFEDEYPETKPVPIKATSPPSRDPSPPDSPEISRVTSLAENTDVTNGGDAYALKLSRTSSNTSLAARALTYEEGRMHRFGQTMRREILKPTGTDDFAHGTSKSDPPEEEHLAALREKLETLGGDEIRSRVEQYGAGEVIKQLGTNVQELRALQTEDPEAFEALRDSQLAAQVNAGLAKEDIPGHRKENEQSNFNSAVTDAN